MCGEVFTYDFNEAVIWLESTATAALAKQINNYPVSQDR